jgi:hypothetical protein
MLRHSKGMAYLPVQENGRIAVFAIFEHAATGIRKVDELGCPARPNDLLREFLPARQCKVVLSKLLHSGKQWMQNFSSKQWMPNFDEHPMPAWSISALLWEPGSGFGSVSSPSASCRNRRIAYLPSDKLIRVTTASHSRFSTAG